VPLPEEMPMTCVLFGDGARGMRLQEYENEEFGVRCTVRKPDRNSEWERTWTSEATGPDVSYESYADLQAAHRRLEGG